MALPKRLVYRCPTCEEYLEARVCDVSVGLSYDEEEHHGVEVTISAFARHDCNGAESPAEQGPVEETQAEERETNG